MISPDLINQFGNKKTKGTLASWMNLGVSVRPDGIALDCDGKYNAESNAAMKQVMAIKPLRSDLFNVLPEGAYGVIALSSPATFVDAGLNQIQDGKDHEKFEADFPKNIGLDYRRDFLTALQGDAVVAAYPGTSDAGDEGPAGMNLLLVVDNSNGGDPAAPVAKFADWVNSKMRENKDMPQTALFVAKPIDGGQEYSLSASYQDKLVDAMNSGAKNSPFHQAKLTADKTVVWATVDHAVLAATSKATLDRAIEAYRAHSGTFAKDADLGTSSAHILDGSQALLMLSPSRIAKGVEHTMNLDQMSPEDRKSSHEVFALFDGLTAPLTIFGGYASSGEGRSGAFIPIDYDKTIDYIGTKMNKK